MTRDDQLSILSKWIDLLFFILEDRAADPDDIRTIDQLGKIYCGQVCNKLRDNSSTPNAADHKILDYPELIGFVKNAKLFYPDQSYQRPRGNTFGELEDLKWIKTDRAHDFRPALSRIRRESVSSLIDSVKGMVRLKDTPETLRDEWSECRETIRDPYFEYRFRLLRDEDETVAFAEVQRLCQIAMKTFEMFSIPEAPLTLRDIRISTDIAGISSKLNRKNPINDFEKLRADSIRALREFDHFVMPLKEAEEILQS